MTVPLQVLFEDNHCLVVDKPAGLLTMGDRTGEPTLVDQAREYLRQKYHKPGNVFVGVVHRLDRPVSGVVLFARTTKAAGRLSEQFRARTVDKTYLALVEGKVSPVQGRLEHHLVKDRVRNVVTVARDADEGRECVLTYRRIQKIGRFTIVEVHPETGRSHQIRVQLAARGWPIVGDRKYGSTTSAGGCICLHAQSLTFTHPISQQPVTVTSSRPAAWAKFETT